MSDEIKMLPRGAGWYWAVYARGVTKNVTFRGIISIPVFVPKIVMDMERLSEYAKAHRAQPIKQGLI